MKRFIVSAAILAMSLVSIQSFAQDPVITASGQRTTCGQHDKCQRSPKCFDPFVDIDLTADQKAKVEKIQRPCVIAGARKSRTEEGRKAVIEQRRKYLDEVKAILTPEQYTQFLENFALKCHGPQARAKMSKKHQAPESTSTAGTHRKHQHDTSVVGYGQHERSRKQR